MATAKLAITIGFRKPPVKLSKAALLKREIAQTRFEVEELERELADADSDMTPSERHEAEVLKRELDLLIDVRGLHQNDGIIRLFWRRVVKVATSRISGIASI